jgi:hypothetical protein
MYIEHIKKLEQGKQGITGLAQIEDKVYVYKISQYLNYLTNHEYLILNGLKDIAHFCPHFCTEAKLIRYPIHPNFKDKRQNPFEESKKPIYLDVLLMEYISDSIPLYDIIKQTKIPISNIMGVIKQTLLADIIAQKKKNLVHYDLHSLNVLMRECRYDDVHLYVLDKDNVVTVPTYGYIPVIIDYGFSFSKDLEKNPSYISLAYTDAGYMSPGFDPIADAKIFLVSVSEDLKECRRHNKNILKFRNIVKNFFKTQNINWRSGWDIHKEPPIIDQLFLYIENTEERSELFKKYPHMCMDIMQSMVTVPFQPQIEGSLKQLRKAYQIFVYEFYKIESEIHNSFYSLYVLRNMMDIARSLRDKYMDKDTRDFAIMMFQRELFTVIQKVAKFCVLRNVHFDNLLCALYTFAEQLEYQLHRLLSKYVKRKMLSYQNMTIQSMEHMYAVIDMNFKDSYKYNDRTRVYIWDSVNETRSVVHLSDFSQEEIDQINSLPHCTIGTYLYKYFSPETEAEVDKEEDKEEDKEVEIVEDKTEAEVEDKTEAEAEIEAEVEDKPEDVSDGEDTSSEDNSYSSSYSEDESSSQYTSSEDNSYSSSETEISSSSIENKPIVNNNATKPIVKTTATKPIVKTTATKPIVKTTKIK